MKDLLDRLEGLVKKLVAALVLRLAGRPAGGAGELREEFRSILVVRQHDQLGDMLCAVPLLKALRLRYPSAHLALVTSPVNHAIMLHNPLLDAVLLYDKKLFLKSPSAAARFWRELRALRAELAVVPATVSFSLTSDLLAIASGARERLGGATLNGEPNSVSGCYTMRVNLDWRATPRRHQALRNADILAPLEIAAEDISTVIGLTATEREDAAAQLRDVRQRHAVLVGFHPGAGKPANRWPAERFAEVANRMAREGRGVVITAGPMDDEQLARMLPLLEAQPLVIERRPLRQVAAIIDRLDLFISNDTGIMHVAGATETSLLALFGPTDPLQWAPVGRKNRFLASPDGDIRSLSVDEVANTAALQLQEKNLNK
jgi:ADP-heptose:LPS heptosyltransferase